MPRPSQPVHSRTVTTQLANGVWVLVLPTPKPAPGYRGVASVQLWVGAGAAAERTREHGCAHLFEHMVFKPYADSRGRSLDLASSIEARGGDVNAFTSHDETVFHATLPADAVVEILDVMVGAVIGREFDPDTLAREQEVVLEEIRQYADDPSARSIQHLMNDLYAEHAYARPVLGEEDEVRSMTPATLRGWQHRQYRGERVVLVVAGPVAPAVIRRTAKRLLGSLPGLTSSASRRKPTRPVAPTSARIRVLRDDVQEAYVRLGWVGGAALDVDSVALDVASVALGQGESSRLAVGIRRGARLVSDAYASYMSGVACGTFIVSAQAEAESAEAATEALLTEVDGLARLPLEAEELARARALLQSSLVYRRETVQGQAHAIGYFATAMGRIGAEDEYFEILAALTPERVRQACAQHLRRDRVAITLLVPRDDTTARQAPAIAKRLARACEPELVTSTRTRSAKPSTDPSPTKDGFGTWHVRLRSGLRVIARPDPEVPVVGGWLVWPGGLRLEPAREAGISSLTGALLNRGTSARDGDGLAREIEGFAAVVDGFSGHNSVGLQTESLSEHLSTVLARALECATDPAFTPTELDEARRIALADLEADADDLSQVAYRKMLELLYGRHPYGRDLRGTPATLDRLDHAKVVRNWARHYPLGRAVLALSGDFDLDVVLGELDELLRRQGHGSPSERVDPMPAWPGGPPIWPSKPITRTLEREREQGHIVIGFPGLALGAPEGAALDVLCSVLGGQAGRLFDVLREREGLVYQVGASSSEHLDGGHVVFYAAASQDKLDAARAAIEREIAKIIETPITEAELERAKRWLVGQFESGLQRRSRVASRMVFGEVYGLGANYYLRYPERVVGVQRGQLLGLAKRLFDPRRRVCVMIRGK